MTNVVTDHIGDGDSIIDIILFNIIQYRYLGGCTGNQTHACQTNALSLNYIPPPRVDIDSTSRQFGAYEQI